MQKREWMNEARLKIASVRGRTLTVEERVQEAIELAGLLLNEAQRIQTEREKKQYDMMESMLQDPVGKAFTIAMIDQCFRSSQPSRIVSQLNSMLQTMGTPRYLGNEKAFAFAVVKKLGRWMPSLFVPMIKAMLRRETATVIIPGEPDKLAAHMTQRHAEGVRVNLNHIGEAILGEEEAQRRLQIYLEDLARPEVEYISVKVSTIFSQINLLAWEATVSVLAERLRELLRVAARHSFKRSNNVVVPKFVNLDMEEYRDLRLTVEVFKKVLDESEFKHQSAGIVLQSYLPDSFPIQQELTEWAMKRLERGGASIKVRIVKGANLAMEQVEASLKGWPQAPYPQKFDVDANFKRMVAYGMVKEHAEAVFLGIASHNLFDIAYAYLFCAENNVDHCVCFEMLEGMADHIRRVVQELTGDMLLYCPAATREEFQYALAYLIRRLDENTAPDNFLRHVFTMGVDSKEWQKQFALFTGAAFANESTSTATRRTQNRLEAPEKPKACCSFDNEPDTDWSLFQNREWAYRILEEWKEKKIGNIPLVIGGETITSTDFLGEGRDPSSPTEVYYRYCQAAQLQVEQALAAAKKAETFWAAVPVAERSQILAEVANSLRLRRGGLIGAMVAGTGKTIPEADAEVSEAVDFAEYYRRNAEEIYGLSDITWKPKGTVLVAPPWNFPCSIPAGSILAALAAGNCVLFKPAPEAVLVGWQLAQAIWEAGIGQDVLQFIPCEDDPVGSSLVKDPRVDAVILTGATDTARLLMKLRPDLSLIAETGGKNSIVVSAAADRDLAIRDILQSAFGHAGQKCSACSLVVLEAEVYDDAHFMNQLRDAAASLVVGSAWDPVTKVNPLIRKPGEALKRGLTQLDEGEEWLLEPHQHPENPQLWSPGIKLGVKPGSFMHQTELFGPVLGIMRAENLEQSIEWANGTRYGLTAGIHSLDEREKSHWLEAIEAGNCYINRGITGAIVQRQPFGGCKDSGFGPGAKAGGPNYVMQLMEPAQIKLPTERERLDDAATELAAVAEKHLPDDAFHIWQASLGSYTFFWKHYFSKDHDPSLIIGQDNFLRYRPQQGLCVRVQSGDTLLDVWRLAAIAAVADISFEVSLFAAGVGALPESGKIVWIVETDEEWLGRAERKSFKKLRLLSSPSSAILQRLADEGLHFHISPILANGRLELLKFLREVSISNDYHRYGNLGVREGEKRKPLPQLDDQINKDVCGTGCCCC